jgi:hypothetical protein
MGDKIWVADPTPFSGLRIFAHIFAHFCAYFGLAPSAYFPPELVIVLESLGFISLWFVSKLNSMTTSLPSKGTSGNTTDFGLQFSVLHQIVMFGWEVWDHYVYLICPIEKFLKNDFNSIQDFKNGILVNK